MKPCKRGNIAERDKWGGCLCVDCKKFRAEKEKRWKSENKDKVATHRRTHKRKALKEEKDAIKKAWSDGIKKYKSEFNGADYYYNNA